MSETADRSFSGDFRRFFLRGLVVLLPSVLTLWIVVQAYMFVDRSIAEPINSGVRLGIAQLAHYSDAVADHFNPTPDEFQEARRERVIAGRPRLEDDALIAQIRRDKIGVWWSNHSWYMDLIGVVIAIISVYVAGRLLGGFFGRRIYKRIEMLITSLPVFKQVYPSVKQVVDFLFSDDKGVKFNRVVCVEYPRKGIWTVGFVTGGTFRQLQDVAGVEAVTVFIPSSPTPFTGYTITVAKADVMDLPITVEEALRFTVSGGVLVPGRVLAQAKADEGAQNGPVSGLPPLPPSDNEP